jgi:hypothetical protein
MTANFTTEADRLAALQAFAATLQDRPLDPAKPEDARLYVKELHVPANTPDSVLRLATQIQRAEGSRVWLFTGNIGSGKSTELRRLRQELLGKGCVVLLADASEYINLNQKIEISDFLISATAAFADIAGRCLNDDQIERGYWERLLDYLTRTQVELPELSAVGVKAALRQDPAVKQLIQDKLRGHITTLANELDAYRSEILVKIRQRHGDTAKIVLVLDSMERLRGSGNAGDEVFSSVRTLFTQYSDLMRLPEIQVVYSVAPYLIKLAPQLGGLFGVGTLCHLTTAHVFQQRSRELDLAYGVPVIRKIVEQRYADWERVLSTPDLDRVIEASGGDLRDLFRLLGIVLLELEFDTELDRVLGYALEQLRRDMTWVTEPQRARLRHIAEHKSPRLADDADRDALVHDLETKRVLMYRNGEDWYDVHPLLRAIVDAPPPGAPDSVASGG